MSADPRQPRRHCDAIICPDHMKGWEAFGIVDRPGELTVRRLGYGHHTPKPTYGTDPWGKGETHRGLHGIEIMTFADAPGSACIYCVGSTEKGVRDAWLRAAEAFKSIASDLWGDRD